MIVKKEFYEKKEIPEKERKLLEKGGLKTSDFFSLLRKTEIGKTENERQNDSTYDFKFLMPEENNQKKVDLISKSLNLGESAYYDSDEIFTVEKINKTIEYTLKFWEEYTGIEFSEDVKNFKFTEDEKVKGKVSNKSLKEFFNKISFTGDINELENSKAQEFYSFFKLLKARVRILSQLSKNGLKEDTIGFHDKLVDFSNHDAIENYGFEKNSDGDFGKVFQGIFTKINQSYVKVYHRMKKVNSANIKAVIKEEVGMEAIKDLHGIKVELKTEDLNNVFITIFNSINDGIKKDKDLSLKISEVKNKNWLDEKEIIEIEKEMSEFGVKISGSTNKKSSPNFKSFAIVFSIDNEEKGTSEKVEIQFNPLQEDLTGWESHNFYKLKTKLMFIEKVTGPGIPEEQIDFQINRFLDEEDGEFDKDFEEIKERLKEKILKNREGSDLYFFS